MGLNRIKLGETARIRCFFFDAARVGVTGATVDLRIRRDLDGYFWNGATFQSAATDVTMTETDSTNLAGFYHYAFLPGSTDFTCTWRATTSAVGVVNSPFVGDVAIGYWVDDIDAAATSRASSSDMSEVLKRFGGTTLDVEMKRIVSFLEQLKNMIAAEKLRSL